MNNHPLEGYRLNPIALLCFACPLTLALLERDGSGAHLGRPGNLALAVVLGGCGGALMARGARWCGAAGGAVAGLCGFLALAWYVAGRETVWKAELGGVLMLSYLPGLLVYGLLRAGSPAAAGGGAGGGRLSPAGVWQCSQCGQQNSRRVEFCRRCGLNVWDA